MNKNQFYDKLRSIAQSRPFLYIIYIIVALLAIVVVFQAGVSVGYQKAAFNQNMNEHYQDNFGPMHPGFIGPSIPNPNGAIGKIISVNGSLIAVEEPNNLEKSILVTDQTIIRQNHDEKTVQSLAPDQYIVVIGEPNNQGQIIARFIRIMPAPQGG